MTYFDCIQSLQRVNDFINFDDNYNVETKNYFFKLKKAIKKTQRKLKGSNFI